MKDFEFLKQVLCFVKFFKLYQTYDFPLLWHWNHLTGLNFHNFIIYYFDEKWFYLYVHYMNIQEAIFYFPSLVYEKSLKRVIDYNPIDAFGRNVFSYIPENQSNIYCMVKTERIWKSFNDKLWAWDSFISLGFWDHKNTRIGTDRVNKRSNFVSYWVCIDMTYNDSKWVFISKLPKGTHADLKISLYVLIYIKIIPWIYGLFNPKNSRVIYP